MPKELISAAAVALTLVLFLPYIRSIRRGQTRPHVFSWIIWGVGTVIVFFAQLAGHGGIGAWPIGISGLVSGYIALLAYRHRGDASITRMDWVFLGSALAALPCWFFTEDPLWAVVILTTSDLLGFGPTLRTSWHRPQEERMGFFGFFSLRNLLAILALEHYSLTTVLFPAAVGLGCLGLVAVIAGRRWFLGRKATGS
jgi:hypothetical protein